MGGIRFGGDGRCKKRSFPFFFPCPLNLLLKEFIHGSDVITRTLAEEHGISVAPVERFSRLRWGSPAVHRSSVAGVDQVYGALKALEQLPHLVDPSLSLLDWCKGLDFEMADVLLAQTCCCDISKLSALDLQLEMRADKSGSHEVEGRLRNGGYSMLLSCMARGLDIHLSSAVCKLTQDGKTVIVETVSGTLYRARVVVVTVSASCLKRGLISFSPELSSAKLNALSHVDVFHATKLIYLLRKRFWDSDTTYLAKPGTYCRFWVGKDELPLISIYVTASRAQHVDAQPEEDALREGLAEIAALLSVDNEAELRASVVRMQRVAWAHNQWIGGGYASVLAGAPADTRRVLAAPEWEGGLVHFAGEHCAWHSNPQTVHGAMESGIMCARNVIKDFCF